MPEFLASIPITGTILTDHKIGNTRGVIMDPGKASPQQRAQMDADIANICWRIINEARAAGKDV